MRQGTKAICAAAALWVASVAQAGSVKDSAEASMLVTGTLQVMPDGNVGSYTLDKPEKLPAAVVDLIKRNVPSWKFALKAPRATPTNEAMSLRVVAHDVDANHMTLQLAGASFSDIDEPDNASLQWAHRAAPNYPKLSQDNHVSGDVYLIARVGRDGKIINVAVEQVNLRRFIPDSNQMARFRKDLADAALRAARNWTFTPPTEGDQANAASWDAQIPCHFNIGGEDAASTPYGGWAVYVRGPRENIAWLNDTSDLAQSPETIPDGSIRQAGAGATLVTPLAPD